MEDLIKEQLDRFNANDEKKATISFVDEFLTLYLDGRRLVDGEVEVLERLQWLNRERGYQFL